MSIDMRLPDISTWTPSYLFTPEGRIRYWVLCDWSNYSERYAQKASSITVEIAVEVNQRNKFRKYALGFSGSGSCNGNLITRFTPLRYPYPGHAKYLVDMESSGDILGGMGIDGKPYAWEAEDTILESYGWPRWPERTGMLPRIKYKCVFSTLPYLVVDQASMSGYSYKEHARYVIRRMTSFSKERELPGYQFETDEASPVNIPQNGFVPYSEYELDWTWVGVPVEYVPWDAISELTGYINEAPFGYCDEYPKIGTSLPSTSYGKYRTGCVQFRGTSGGMDPYLGNNAEWLIDIPYKFHWQPADGGNDGQLKIPRGFRGEWVKVRQRGSGASPVYTKKKGDFERLFKPTCAVCPASGVTG